MMHDINNDKLRDAYNYFNTIDKVLTMISTEADSNTNYMEKFTEVKYQDHKEAKEYIEKLRERCDLIFTLDLISIFETEAIKIIKEIEEWIKGEEKWIKGEIVNNLKEKYKYAGAFIRDNFVKDKFERLKSVLTIMRCEKPLSGNNIKDIKKVDYLIKRRDALAHGKRDFGNKTNLMLKDAYKLLDNILYDIKKI